MTPPAMPTSAVRGGPPFPSATVPPRITRSKALTFLSSQPFASAVPFGPSLQPFPSAVLKRYARLVGRFGTFVPCVGDDEFAGLEATFGGHGGQFGAERLGRAGAWGRRLGAAAGQR